LRLNLEKLVGEYLQGFYPCDPCADNFAVMETIESAISVAALSTTSDGKRHSHQRRIPGRVLERVSDTLSAKKAEIQNAETFDHLHSIVLTTTDWIKGAGPLLAYDITMRICDGFLLRLQPIKVYLHAGAMVGAKKLGVASEKASRGDFPKEIHVLTSAQIEDFLCRYKDRL
jgi:hypothetical protein